MCARPLLNPLPFRPLVCRLLWPLRFPTLHLLLLLQWRTLPPSACNIALHFCMLLAAFCTSCPARWLALTLPGLGPQG